MNIMTNVRPCLHALFFPRRVKRDFSDQTGGRQGRVRVRRGKVPGGEERERTNTRLSCSARQNSSSSSLPSGISFLLLMSGQSLELNSTEGGSWQFTRWRGVSSPHATNTTFSGLYLRIWSLNVQKTKSDCYMLNQYFSESLSTLSMRKVNLV